MHTDNVTIPAQIHPEGSPEWERVSWGCGEEQEGSQAKRS